MIKLVKIKTREELLKAGWVMWSNTLFEKKEGKSDVCITHSQQQNLGKTKQVDVFEDNKYVFDIRSGFIVAPSTICEVLDSELCEVLYETL